MSFDAIHSSYDLGQLSNALARAPQTFTVNCLNQVRIWISSNGLPAKHRARLARLRVMNDGGRILLIVAESILTPRALREVLDFTSRLDIDVCDIGQIPPNGPDERIILEHIHAEIRACLPESKTANGNLSVVSDYARLLTSVIERGMCADMDVEFTYPLHSALACVPCPLGIVARFKDNGCLSNDVTAGLAQSKPFQIARRNAATLVTIYREAASRFLAEVYEEVVDPSVVSGHPKFFELRNRQHDPSLAGTARFSLAGGPDNLAIAFHEAGLACGYELGVKHDVDAGDLTSEHVPHTLAVGTSSTKLTYKPFEFGPPPSAIAQAKQRLQLWPDCLPRVICHWDHSWIADYNDWQFLTYRERLLLAMLNGDAWRRDDALSIIGKHPLPRCLVDPAGTKNHESVARRTASVLSPPGQKQEPERPNVRVGSSAEWTTQRCRKSEENLFQENGIASVSGLIDEPLLIRLRNRFESEISKKGEMTSLQQLSFNLAVDECARDTIELINNVAHLPGLTEVLDKYFGAPSRFVSARGYRQGPCKPIRYRAWDYHQDMKTKGPFEEVKVMVLLKDVSADGQAMRYVCGSQKVKWDFQTQQETKFTLDEALQCGNGGLFLGHGAAGDCIVFDTNGIHSGYRNLSATRDVFTLNFARKSDKTFFMFSDPVLLGAASGRKTTTPHARSLAWRTLVEDNDRLAAIRAEYRATPDLTARKPRWHGDALDLADVISADLNVDLDLRLSARFEDDRRRDIALVKIRDAALENEQYGEVISRLHTVDGKGSCLWEQRNPLVAASQLGTQARSVLFTRVQSEAAANCSALLYDLCDALGRCDGVQRLRTTAAFLYCACAWAHRLVAAAGGESLEEGCRQLLDLYVHIVAEDDLIEIREATRRDA